MTAQSGLGVPALRIPEGEVGSGAGTCAEGGDAGTEGGAGAGVGVGAGTGLMGAGGGRVELGGGTVGMDGSEGSLSRSVESAKVSSFSLLLLLLSESPSPPSSESWAATKTDALRIVRSRRNSSGNSSVFVARRYPIMADRSGRDINTKHQVVLLSIRKVPKGGRSAFFVCLFVLFMYL